MRSTRKTRINNQPLSEADPPWIGLQQKIAENAYYRAEARGFAPGGELDDWLSAEAEIKSSGHTSLS